MMLLTSRFVSGQTGVMNHEVKIVIGAGEESVRLAEIDDQHVAFAQLDCLPLDKDRGRATSDEIALGDPRGGMRLINALVGEANRNGKIAVPRPCKPALRIVVDPL